MYTDVYNIDLLMLCPHSACIPAVLFPGGSIGTVAVTWFINTDRTTASRGADYIADGATLTFLTSETTQSN